MRALLLAAAIASVHTPTRGPDRTAFPVIDAYGGRVVWSDYDASIDSWRLMERSGGAVRAIPVAPRSSPFDVDLGPDGHGGTLAVYSRCSGGCDLYSYSFRTGSERPVKRANSHADETWPAVWGSRIAFVRTYGNRRDRFGRRVPFLFWRGRAGRGASHRLRLPVTPRRETALVDGLDMRGRTVAYTWNEIDDFNTYSFIYRATTGGGLRAVARGAWFNAGAADSLKRVSQPALGAGGIDWLYRDTGLQRYRAAFLRRHGGGVRASTPVSKAAAFAHAGHTSYWIDAGPGDYTEPEAQPGGTFPLLADDAVRYRAVPRSWLRVTPPR